jgi:hypothetical protein
MANRIVNYCDDGTTDGAYCKGCERSHGPLYLCDCYDAEDIDEVNRLREGYAQAYQDGKLGLMGVFFPPAPPMQNWRAN